VPSAVARCPAASSGRVGWMTLLACPGQCAQANAPAGLRSISPLAPGPGPAPCHIWLRAPIWSSAMGQLSCAWPGPRSPPQHHPHAPRMPFGLAVTQCTPCPPHGHEHQRNGRAHPPATSLTPARPTRACVNRAGCAKCMCQTLDPSRAPILHPSTTPTNSPFAPAPSKPRSERQHWRWSYPHEHGRGVA